MAVFDSFWRLTGATGIAGGPDTADNFGVNPPKLKFNYTVSFIPRDVQLPYIGSPAMEENAFAAKTIGRPKASINYQDINFYNFRTKVGVKSEMEQVSATFYDDPDNKSHSIINNYLKAVSPIAGTTSNSAADNFDRNGQGSSASLGALQGNRHGPLQAIIIGHYYWSQGAVKNTFYYYLNPKISSMEYDDLDMTQSEVNTITFSFYFDSFYSVSS